MKKIASIFFILLLAFTFSTCHKKQKIPKDIPKWLQEIIKKEQKESGWILSKDKWNLPAISHGPRDSKKMLIKEYTDGSSTYYYIEPDRGGYYAFKYYNYDGVEVCAYEEYVGPTCGWNSGYLNMTFVRIVFEE